MAALMVGRVSFISPACVRGREASLTHSASACTSSVSRLSNERHSTLRAWIWARFRRRFSRRSTDNHEYAIIAARFAQMAPKFDPEPTIWGGEMLKCRTSAIPRSEHGFGRGFDADSAAGRPTITSTRSLPPGLPRWRQNLTQNRPSGAEKCSRKVGTPAQSCNCQRHEEAPLAIGLKECRPGPAAWTSCASYAGRGACHAACARDAPALLDSCRSSDPRAC